MSKRVRKVSSKEAACRKRGQHLLKESSISEIYKDISSRYQRYDRTLNPTAIGKTSRLIVVPENSRTSSSDKGLIKLDRIKRILGNVIAADVGAQLEIVQPARELLLN